MSAHQYTLPHTQNSRAYPLSGSAMAPGDRHKDHILCLVTLAGIFQFEQYKVDWSMVNHYQLG